MFAIAAVIVFALALLLDIIDAGPDFAWVVLGLLLLACHFAFGDTLRSRLRRNP